MKRSRYFLFWLLAVLGYSQQVFAVQMTPRQAIYYHASHGNKSALVRLKQMGYPIDVSDDYGNSALCEAVIKKDKQAIQILLQVGADTQADCMKELTFPSQVSVQKATGVEVDQRNKLASEEISKIPNPPAEPLSKNAKVGIGLGVATALIGGGAAIAMIGGGGGGSDALNCVDGVQVGRACHCNEHALGDLCNYCEAGWGLHNTNSCHKDIVCKANAHQEGDACVCDAGYTVEDETACWTDLGCSIYVNMHQEKNKCVCDSGYDFQGTLGCFEKKTCPTHSVQIESICVCQGQYYADPETQEKDGSAKECIDCGANKVRKNDQCVCDDDHPVKTISGTGENDFTCGACPAHSTWNGERCVCNSDYPKPSETGGLLTACSQCENNSTWDSAQAICACSGEYPVEYVDEVTQTRYCYEKLTCGAHAKQIQNECVCDTGWTKDEEEQCSLCDTGYTKVEGHCLPISDSPKIAKNNNNGHIKLEINSENELIKTEGDDVSLDSSENLLNLRHNINTGKKSNGTYIYPDWVEWQKALVALKDTDEKNKNLIAANAEGAREDIFSYITVVNQGSYNIAGMYSGQNNVDGASNNTSTYTSKSHIILKNGYSTSYGMYGEKNIYGAYNTGGGYTYSGIRLNVPEVEGKSPIAYGIYNPSGGTIYGAYDTNTESYNCDGRACTRSVITIVNKNGTGDSYGMYSFNITKVNNDGVPGAAVPTSDEYGTIYGAYDNQSAGQRSVYSKIDIYQWGGKAYGMYGGRIYSSNTERIFDANVVENEINITLIGHQADDPADPTKKIATGEAYGMYSPFRQETRWPNNNWTGKGPFEIVNTKTGIINIDYIGGTYQKVNSGEDVSSVTAQDITDETRAFGIFLGNKGHVTNAGTIIITRPTSDHFFSDTIKLTDNFKISETYGSEDSYDVYFPLPLSEDERAGEAYGIYYNTVGNDGGHPVGGTFSGQTTISNSGTIKISGDFKKAYGIYVNTGSDSVLISNSGTIDLSEAPNGKAIYFHGGSANCKINNTGTLMVSGKTCSGENCKDVANQFIDASAGILSKSTFANSGTTTSANSLDLSSLGTTVTAGSGGKFQANGDIYGMLHLDSDIVSHGFDKTYTEKDMISATDTSGLTLQSESALFDAKLADNGKDVVMTMKGFDTATTNKSLANFLSKNYALGNNEAFYNKLKSFGNVSALTDSLNKLTGRDMLSRFNFEDMTMMRELNFDMNEKLFHNKEQHFALAGSVSPMAFRGDTGSNVRYSLFNKRDGNTSIGLGVAFTNVRSDDTHEDNDRHETSYQLILPLGYKAGGLNMVTSPRIGYARGTYDRTGFDEKTYDGTIEKRVFGLMNEARYPITVGKWKLEPSAEFNILGYRGRGQEDAKEFALNIQSQNTYSVEGGIGLYATREEELDKDTTLKLTAGMAAYHEFADPYRVKVGMNGMDGAFTLRDENRSDNRGVIRAGFDYSYRDLSLYGSLISYIDREARTSAKTGMRLKF